MEGDGGPILNDHFPGSVVLFAIVVSVLAGAALGLMEKRELAVSSRESVNQIQEEQK